MASRRKVTQDDLRKAMNEAKRKVATVKKIESPLAKYAESGQLMCILCGTAVRGEAIWPVHLNSKGHKDRVEATKRSIVRREDSEGRTAKRRVSPNGETDGDANANKRIKSILRNGREAKTRSNLPLDFFDDSSKRGQDAAAPGSERVPPPKTWERSDKSDKSDKSEIPRVERSQLGGTRERETLDAKDETNVAALPEGFFDDPRMDARVRNVDYKDPIEEEWDKFQREIKEEAAQSAQIIADDQEEATTVRQLDEIEEQMRNWTRVMEFVKLKDEFRASVKVSEDAGENERSDDEGNDEGNDDGDDNNDDDDEDGNDNDNDDYDEFLDWRAKNSYRR